MMIGIEVLEENLPQRISSSSLAEQPFLSHSLP
jgi:hypothetical protein